MSIVKSVSVGEGDLFYIKHGSNNFTIIDCNIEDDEASRIIKELKAQRQGKEITRFISTHPDEDHIHGLKILDQEMNLLNFYCVKNSATKKEQTIDFKHYCSLRDDVKKVFYVYRGCSRKWMNDNDENDGQNYGSSGINFLWPNTSNKDYQEALKDAAEGTAFNNISPVFTYEVDKGIKVMWMGDMEHDFLEKVKNEIDWPKIDILFAPHHGRDSGKVSEDVLDKLNPKIIVVGEAPSEHLNYYRGHNTITQNTAKDITFECSDGLVNVYFSNRFYPYDLSFLNRRISNPNYTLGYYAGSFVPRNAL